MISLEFNVFTFSNIISTRLAPASYAFFTSSNTAMYLSFIKSCSHIDYYIVIIFFIILFFGVGTALYILSKLFEKATNYKEENDLTI